MTRAVLGALLTFLILWPPEVLAQELTPPMILAETETTFLDTTLCGATETQLIFLAALAIELELAAATEEPPETELRAESPNHNEGPNTETRRISICDVAAGRLELQLGPVRVTIDVSDIPAVARPRTAAVAVAETLRNTPVGEAALHTSAPTSNLALPAKPLRSSLGPDAPETRGPFDAGITLREIYFAPQQTLLWGTGMHAGYRPHPTLRAQLSVSYLTTSKSFPLGNVRLHAGALGAALLWVFGEPTALRVEAGAGLEAMMAALKIESTLGFNEPSQREWALFGDVRATLLSPLTDRWEISAGLAVAKDLKGVHFLAGGEDGLSLYGWGLGAQLGLRYAF